TENKIFECIYEIAISTKNDLLCNKIKSDIQKDMCLRNIAINKKDDLLCKKIDNKLDKEMCLREIAIETSNKEICNDLTDVNRDICIHHFIVFDGDLDSCTNIKNEELSLNCKINIAINSEDDTICFNLENEDKNICFKIFANFHANNLSYCKNIIDKDKVKYCYNTLTNEINENHNLDFCEIEPDIYYDNCLSKLAKEKEDSYLCSLINNTEDRDSCYDYNILRDNEISSCSQIQFFSNSRFSSFGECESFIYYNNALEQKDVSICDKIPFSNLSYKNSCYKTLAYELDNSQLCEKIDYIGDKDECYSSLCIENENLELCDQIKDSLFKDWSKTIIAINTNNENICNTIIQDDFFKQECIKNIDS
ncbi:hypothetical protein HN415_05660, partial [Candidatus Woesearchaeota archaeon]|nr:hypothetical protein [Candidatus Woesearchaeota archaeon]